MRRLAVIGIAGLALAGCTTLSGDPLGASTARGRTFAQGNCAACHAIGSGGKSPLEAAPNFGVVHRRYTEPGLGRELEAIAVVGHYGMPATSIEPPDRRDLVAYIGALRSPVR